MVINYLDSKRISALSSDFATTTSYNHIADTGDDFLNLHDTNRYAVMKILSGSPAIGTSVQKIKISMRKVGTPAGTFKVGIWNASDVLVISVTNTASSFLTTSYVDYEFDMGSATELLLDYKVGIEYLTGVGVSNRIDVETIYATTETGYSKGYPALNTGGVDLDILMSFDSTPVTISKPTNVQDNSILVEKDTGRRYWFDDAFNKTGLKAYYKFDETSGNLINQSTSVGSADSLGTNADGTASGNPTYSETGVIDSAINFDGVGDYFELGSSNSQWNFLHNDSAHWTLSFWMKLNSIEHSGIDGIMGTHAYSASSNVGMGLFLRDDSANDHMLEVQIGNVNANPTPFTSSASYIPKNTTTWYHYIITNDYDGTNNINIYRDNANNESGTIAGTNTNGNSDHSMLLALDAVAQGRFSDCLFDEFSMWDRVITADERAELYNSGTGKTVDTAKSGATWTREYFPPTDTALFGTISGWTGDTSTFTYDSSINGITVDTSTLGEAVMKTITTLSASGEWVMRFKVKRDTGDVGDGTFLNIGSSSASTSSLARMQNGNGLYPYGIHFYFANTNSIYAGGSHDTAFAWDSSAVIIDSWAAGDSKWVEISHASSSTYTTKVYDNANFTGTPTGTTIITNMSGQTLDYDNIAMGTKWTANRKHIDFEDMQIWNGVTSAPQ
tara:strand:+ start:672 stop:2690 length:2019 start_codon:yes stop_codon:yes gene_type:complete